MDILYQDASLVLCEKPFRVLSTDEPGGMPDLIRETLCQPEAQVRTVHRLDRVVGGLMVYALTSQAASHLSRQIREESFLKEYLAVIHWRPKEDQGTFCDLLARDDRTRKTYVTQTPAKGVQEATLHYQLLDNQKGFSLVRIQLETGRTHQIRAQFSARGLPLAGDRKYSKYPDPKDWQIALWSCHLSFTHPETGEAMDFQLPPPQTEPWCWFAQPLDLGGADHGKK